MRILCVDPGMKRIGLAVTGESGMLARPLAVIQRASYRENAAQILQVAASHQVEMILVGQSIGDDGAPTYTGRLATRLADAIRSASELPLSFWDESMSTSDARQARAAMGAGRKKRQASIDAEAAAVILQGYLDNLG